MAIKTHRILAAVNVSFIISAQLITDPFRHTSF